MKKKIIFILMLFSFVASTFSNSFLDAVKEAEETEEAAPSSEKSKPAEKNPPKKDPPPPKKPYGHESEHHRSNSYNSSSYSRSSEPGSSFAELLIDLFGILWLGTNVGVQYCEYPYQYSSVMGYSRNRTFESGYMGISDAYYADQHYRPYRFSLDTSYFKLGDEQGNETKFEGQFWFIGPYFENTVVADNPYDVSCGTYGNIKLGGQFFLIQTNFVNASFVAQWSKWYGNRGEYSPLTSGYSIGFDIRSYPFKPIVLDWKVAWDGFKDNDVGIFQSNLNAGFLINRVEFYAAWRYKKVYGRKTDYDYSKFNGYSLGARLFF